jgi:hypothetical protein
MKNPNSGAGLMPRVFSSIQPLDRGWYLDRWPCGESRYFAVHLASEDNWASYPREKGCQTIEELVTQTCEKNAIDFNKQSITNKI